MNKKLTRIAFIAGIATTVCAIRGLAQVSLPSLSGYSFTAISLPSGLANTNVQVYGINDSNQVAGLSYGGSQPTKAFVFQNGTATQISIPGYTNAAAFDINNNGQVVGNFGNGDIGTTSQAFVYHGGIATTLNLPSVTHGVAHSINDSGVIVGVRDNSSYSYSGGTETAIALPGNPSAYAYGINNNGTAVGMFSSSGFSYTSGASTTITVPGAASTAVQDINDAGVMVGQYGSGGVHGWIRTGGVFYEIAFPGATQTWATGINNNGVISGFYSVSGVDGFTGFVASPIPEPSTWGLLGGIVVLGMGGARRVQRRKYWR